ncbi:MAG TPA: FG-GAP-like repeat-containing protein [Hanamia sp.]|nr:FG-GAP-like repeat-containing protein [Hanamia sp.]
MISLIHSPKNYFPTLLICLVIILLVAGCNQKSKQNSIKTSNNPKGLALLYLSENHLDEAVAAFQQAIKMHPEDSSTYIGLTRLYLLQKNYDDAENLCIEGLKIKPNNIDLMLLLAEAYSLKNDKENAVKELQEILAKDSKNAIAYYQLAQLDNSDSTRGLQKYYLLKVQNLVPANIVPRLQLAELFAGESKTDSSLFYLQSVKKIAPGFSDAAENSYQKAASLLDANKPTQAIPYLKQFHGLMKITPEYATGIENIEIPKMVAGYFSFDTNIPVSTLGNPQSSNTDENNSFNAPLKFTDVPEIPGYTIGNNLKAENAVIAVADYDAQGNMYLYSSYLTPGATSSKCSLSAIQMGAFKECKVTGGIEHKGQDLYATFADYDNDGYQDLFIATTNGILVYKNNGDGTFSRITEDIGLHNVSNVTKILFADFDQDGDLDMYVAQKGGNKFFRNNGDGTFTENAAAMGLVGDKQGTIDMDFGDWDNDGDLDIVGVTNDGKVELFNNNRHSSFKDIRDSVGLQNPDYAGTAVAFGDYNNDGMLDIFIAGGPNGKCTLLKNDGNHHFVPDVLASDQMSKSLNGIKVHQVSFIDYDNDGYKDILVAGINKDSSKRGIRLFHNDGSKGFSDVSNLFPENVMQAYHFGIADYNFDGDRDIFFAGPNGIRLARNDGGNYNNFVQVQLTGLSFGNSKNNRLGIGAQVELKAGNLYQMKTVKGPLVEFGVGKRTKLDVLRIIWPNGVAQTINDPTRKQRTLEEAELKGSCPFLFTWNGKKYEFLKDMLWRSALGIPVAIHGTDTTFAYSNPSKEYLLIPGEKLKPKDGLYSIKISEELWEAVYLDKAELVAVDHPDSVNAFVDERFVAPPYPGRKVYVVSHEHLPVSATDGYGNNVMPKISKYDFQYVSNFSLGKFQGVAKEHDLILDLGKKAEANKLHLFLRGWIFPTDASINTELTQTKKWQVHPPSLQVINKEGKWQTVIKDIGYPMGRDKMVIVNLSGKFLTPDDRRVRIRTNMQIYWDHIFFSTGHVKAPVKMHDLKMVSADLHYRGYSSSYQKGGPYGPQWFNYYNVSKGQKWRDLTGYYTRYGDVLPLLQKADDEYIIANSGDQVSINFDAKDAPLLPKGWKRDFLIYSEGWVKDGDLNTAYGQTVAPLPFHAMPSYPYGKNVRYPTDKAHREYQKKYNTRKVSDYDFINAVRLGIENRSE